MNIFSFMEFWVTYAPFIFLFCGIAIGWILANIWRDGGKRNGKK